MGALMGRGEKVSFRFSWRLAALFLLLGATSCGRKTAEPTAENADWIARVNGEPITEQEVQFEIQRRTEARRPVGDAQSILEELIQRKAMLSEARRSGLLQDPAVQRELENRELGQWIDRTLQVERDGVSVSNEEMRAYYDANRESFTRPAMARLAILYRRAPRSDSTNEAVEVRGELEKGRAAYLADPSAATQQGRISGFGALAAGYSEDAISRYRGGDIGWINVGEESRLPAAVVETGLALDVGGVSDVVAAGGGFYVVMKTDQRAAQVTPYKDVAPTLRRKLIRQKQESIQSNFVNNLLAGAQIEINEQKAAEIHVPPAPTVSPLELRPFSDLKSTRSAAAAVKDAGDADSQP